MNLTRHAIKMGKKQPLGCLTATVVSAVLVMCAISGIIFLAYAMAIIPTIKNTVYSKTGFYLISESVFVNVFTGECTFNGVVMENPSVKYEGKVFFSAPKIMLDIAPKDLLLGKFVFSKIEMDIAELNCVRMNESEYNISDFLEQMSAISKVRDGGLQKLDIKLGKATYYDVSTKDKMRWNVNVKMHFTLDDCKNEPILEALGKRLDNENVSFVSRGLKSLSKKGSK